jgi:uncharacterized protein with NAD-binding domain and iron-sulfur cluster
MEWDAPSIRNLLVNDLRKCFQAFDERSIVRTLPLRERRATYLPVPGLERLRPGPATEIPGFYLAGDWTATGLPATIESAARSGHTAAELLLSER